MSAVENLVDLAPFRRAVAALISLTLETPEDSLRTLLSAEISRPMRSEPDDGSQLDDARRAFATLYEIAEISSIDEVLTDLEDGEIDLGRARQNLAVLLQPSDEVTDRVEGRRQRDAMLPNLQEVRLAADFRVVSLSGGDELAPIITARLGFDESIAGSPAVTFQIAVNQVDDIVQGLQETRDSIRRLSEQTDALRVARWAKVPSS